MQVGACISAARRTCLNSLASTVRGTGWRLHQPVLHDRVGWRTTWLRVWAPSAGCWHLPASCFWCCCWSQRSHHHGGLPPQLHQRKPVLGAGTRCWPHVHKRTPAALSVGWANSAVQTMALVLPEMSAVAAAGRKALAEVLEHVGPACSSLWLRVMGGISGNVGPFRYFVTVSRGGNC
jgi:hypothetical protein